MSKPAKPLTPEGFKKLSKDAYIRASDVIWDKENNFRIVDTCNWPVRGEVGKNHVFRTENKRLLDLLYLCIIMTGRNGSIIRPGRRMPGFNPDNLAHALWIAGTESLEVSSSNMVIAEQRTPFNMKVIPGSMTMKPYIAFDFLNNSNVLWYLLKLVGISYGGSASEFGTGRVQASFGPKLNETNFPDKKLLHLNALGRDNFIFATIMYFNALKKDFGLATDYYKTPESLKTTIY